MSQVASQKFGAEYVAHLRELLDIAAEQIGPEHRTLANGAKVDDASRHNREVMPQAQHPADPDRPAGEDRTS